MRSDTQTASRPLSIGVGTAIVFVAILAVSVVLPPLGAAVAACVAVAAHVRGDRALRALFATLTACLVALSLFVLVSLSSSGASSEVSPPVLVSP